MTELTGVSADAKPLAPSTSCPPWCEDEHANPFDVGHASALEIVDLSAHTYEVNGETVPFSMLSALYQDTEDGPLMIGVSGHNEIPGDMLTLGEAEEFAHRLLALVAKARAAGPPAAAANLIDPQ